MRGLALRSIGFLILAVISIGLLLTLMGGPIRNMANSVFCSVYGIFSAIVPEAEPPIFCQQTKCYAESKNIHPDSKENLATHIAAYAINCYQEKGTPCKSVDNVNMCYELHIKNPYQVTETDVTQIMEADYQNGCMLLENSKVMKNGQLVEYEGDCGQKDNLDWRLQGGERLILVQYDLKRNKVIVK